MSGLTPKCRHCKAHRKINVQNLNKIFKFEQNLLCGNLDKDDNSALLCLTIQQSGFGAWTPHAFFEEIIVIIIIIIQYTNGVLSHFFINEFNLKLLISNSIILQVSFTISIIFKKNQFNFLNFYKQLLKI